MIRRLVQFHRSMGVLFCVLPTIVAAIPESSFSGETPATETQLIEDGRIEIMNDYLAVKLKFDSGVRGFDVESPGLSFDIRPNASTTSRIAVNYRFLSLSYGYTPGFLPGNSDDDLRGDTKARSYSLTLNFRHWVQGLSYNRVEGFYLENTRDFVPGWLEGEDSYILFPELVYTGFEGFTAYKVNPGFSFKALSTQTERQRESTGSLMPLVFYNYYIVDNQIELTGQNSSQKSDNLELLASLAYFHTLVMGDNFYISGGVVPGAGLIRTKLLTRVPEGDFTDTHSHPIYRVEVQGALGYNGSRFFAGTQVIASWARFNQDGPSNVIVTERLTYQLFAGYRLDAPGFLVRATDWITGLP